MTAHIWGHRGCRGPLNPPENSLAAFEAALAQGADGIELDIFLTRDQQLVVFHDDRLERMTDGRGDISNHTLAELKRFYLKDAEGRLTSQQIPTYEDVLNRLEHIRRPGRPFRLNTEIKGLGIAEYVEKSIEGRLERGWDMTDFLISSFDMQSLREIRELNPAIALGALFVGGMEEADIKADALQEHIAQIQDIRPETINLTLASFTPEIVRIIRESGAAPVAWTYNEVNPFEIPDVNRNAILWFLNQDGATLITDYPREVRELITPG